MAKRDKEHLTAVIESPLRWPDGWPRTPIKDRESRSSWKRTKSQYLEGVTAELQRMGATKVVISFHGDDRQRLDPGVAVWFALQVSEDFSWQQTGRGIAASGIYGGAGRTSCAIGITIEGSGVGTMEAEASRLSREVHRRFAGAWGTGLKTVIHYNRMPLHECGQGDL